MEESINLQAVIDVLSERLKQSELQSAYLTALVNQKQAEIERLNKSIISEMDVDTSEE